MGLKQRKFLPVIKKATHGTFPRAPRIRNIKKADLGVWTGVPVM